MIKGGVEGCVCGGERTMTEGDVVMEGGRNLERTAEGAGYGGTAKDKEWLWRLG